MRQVNKRHDDFILIICVKECYCCNINFASERLRTGKALFCFTFLKCVKVSLLLEKYHDYPFSIKAQKKSHFHCKSPLSFPSNFFKFSFVHTKHKSVQLFFFIQFV